MEEKKKEIFEYLAGINNAVQQLDLKPTEHNVRHILAILNTTKVIGSNLQDIVKSVKDDEPEIANDAVVESEKEETDHGDN